MSLLDLLRRRSRIALDPNLRIEHARCDVCDAPAWWTVNVVTGESFEDEVQSWHRCPGRYVTE